METTRERTGPPPNGAESGPLSVSPRPRPAHALTPPSPRAPVDPRRPTTPSATSDRGPPTILEGSPGPRVLRPPERKEPGTTLHDWGDPSAPSRPRGASGDARCNSTRTPRLSLTSPSDPSKSQRPPPGANLSPRLEDLFGTVRFGFQARPRPPTHARRGAPAPLSDVGSLVYNE